MLLTKSLKQKIRKATKKEVSELHDFVFEEWFKRI